MARVRPLARKPAHPPALHGHKWVFAMSWEHQRGALAYYEGLPCEPDLDGLDGPDMAWGAYYWTLGWLSSDDVLIAVGAGASAALAGLGSDACPWRYLHNEWETLMNVHWGAGWMRRGGREQLQLKRTAACEVVPFPGRALG